jgi:hypothetical protein
VGSMDHPVWWDEEMAVAIAHRMECTLATRSHVAKVVTLPFPLGSGESLQN